MFGSFLLILLSAMSPSDSTGWQMTGWGETTAGLQMQARFPTSVTFGDTIPVLIELRWVGLPYQPRRELPNIKVLGFNLDGQYNQVGFHHYCNLKGPVPVMRRPELSEPVPCTCFPWLPPTPSIDRYSEGATMLAQIRLRLRVNGSPTPVLLSSPAVPIEVLPGPVLTDTIVYTYPRLVVLNGDARPPVFNDLKTVELTVRKGFVVFSVLGCLGQGFLKTGLPDYSHFFDKCNRLLEMYPEKSARALQIPCHITIKESSEGFADFGIVLGYGERLLLEDAIEVTMESTRTVDTTTITYHQTYILSGPEQSDLVPNDTLSHVIIAPTNTIYSHNLTFTKSDQLSASTHGPGLPPLDSTYMSWLLWNMAVRREIFSLSMGIRAYGQRAREEPTLLWHDTVEIQILDRRDNVSPPPSPERE